MVLKGLWRNQNGLSEANTENKEPTHDRREVLRRTPPLFSAYDSTFESKGSGKTFAHGLVRNTAVGSNTPPPGVVSV